MHPARSVRSEQRRQTPQSALGSPTHQPPLFPSASSARRVAPLFGLACVARRLQTAAGMRPPRALARPKIGATRGAWVFQQTLRGRLKSREGPRGSALGRMARRARGSIPAAGCDRACNAARRPKALSARPPTNSLYSLPPRRPGGLPRFWRWPALLGCSLGRDRCGYRRCARALPNAKIDATRPLPTF